MLNFILHEVLLLILLTLIIFQLMVYLGLEEMAKSSMTLDHNDNNVDQGRRTIISSITPKRLKIFTKISHYERPKSNSLFTS